LRDIAEITSNVTDVVASIANSSIEQADEIAKIQDSMEDIYKGIHENTGKIQTNTSISEQLSNQAGTLKDLVGRFKTKSKKLGRSIQLCAKSSTFTLT
jgi:methyl-accepting chemotaxis protein